MAQTQTTTGFLSSLGPFAGLLGSLVSAGGNLAGGLLSQQKTPSSGKTASVSGYVDPRTQQLAALALQQLGIYTPGSGTTGSPFATLVSSETNRGGWTQDNLTRMTEEFNKAIASVEGGTRYAPGDRAWMLNYAAQRAGYKDALDLAQAEAQFRAGRSNRESSAQTAASGNAAARTASQAELNRLVSSYQAPTQESINALQTQYRDKLLRDIDQRERDTREQALQSAQLGGFNPAGVLGRDNERYTIERRNAEVDALAQALQLLQGQQTSAQNAYTLLTGALQNPVTSAQNTAQISGQQSATAAQIAAQQAIAQLQAQQGVSANNAQALGAGTAGAANSLSGLFGQEATINLWKRIQEMQNQPGSTTPSATYQPAAYVSGQNDRFFSDTSPWTRDAGIGANIRKDLGY